MLLKEGRFFDCFLLRHRRLVTTSSTKKAAKDRQAQNLVAWKAKGDYDRMRYWQMSRDPIGHYLVVVQRVGILLDVAATITTNKDSKVSFTRFFGGLVQNLLLVRETQSIVVDG